MVDSPRIPPQPPAQTQAPPAPRSAVEAAPVTSLPPDLPPPSQPVKLEGEIKTNAPNRQEVTVTTAKGDITVQATTALPVGAKVTLDLYMMKAKVLVDISLQRQQNAAVKSAMDILTTAQTPAAPLKPGDIISAILVPKESHILQTPAMNANLGTQIIAQMNETAFKSLPGLPDFLQPLAGSSNKIGDFLNLPALQQQEALSFFSKPETINALKNFLPPNIFSQISPSPVEGDDSSLLHVLRAQTFAQLTQNALSDGKPASAAFPNALQSLMPLIAGLSKGMSPAEIAMQGMSMKTESLTPQMPQNMHQMKISMILPPGTPVPADAVEGMSLGKIDWITASGTPVLKAPQGDFLLKTTSPLPVGTTIVFDAKPLNQNPSAMTEWDADFYPMQSTKWPALQQALHAALAASPQVAAALQSTIPTATTQLPPATLFFLAALRTGMIGNWLGDDTLQSLRSAGKKGLVEKLSGDFTHISNEAKAAGEWRSISIPLLHDNNLSQMQLYIRQQQDFDEKESDDGVKKPMTRFVLNIHLSRIGDLQLDGLLRKQQFDLVLRSADKLPESIRRDLMQAFARGLAQTEMQGGISFQTRDQNWMIPMPEKESGITA
jgi:hypothetical protein